MEGAHDAHEQHVGPPYERIYALGELTAAELRVEVLRFFAVAGGDARVREDASDAGVDLDRALEAGPGEVRVEHVGAGFTGFEEAILVMLIQEAGDRLWDHVIHPWLQRRRENALGAEEPREGNAPPPSERK